MTYIIPKTGNLPDVDPPCECQCGISRRLKPGNQMFLHYRLQKPVEIPKTCCKNAVKGSTLFCVCNIAATLLTSTLTFAAAAFWFAAVVYVDLKTPVDNYKVEGSHYFATFALFAGVIVMMLLSFIAFALSALLLNGVCEKYPKLLKLYFLNGQVVNMLGVTAAAVYTTLENKKDPVTVCVVTLFLLAYYTFLAMIRVAFNNFKQNVIYHYGNQVLVVSIETPEEMAA